MIRNLLWMLMGVLLTIGAYQVRGVSEALHLQDLRLNYMESNYEGRLSHIEQYLGHLDRALQGGQ